MKCKDLCETSTVCSQFIERNTISRFLTERDALDSGFRVGVA